MSLVTSQITPEISLSFNLNVTKSLLIILLVNIDKVNLQSITSTKPFLTGAITLGQSVDEIDTLNVSPGQNS